MNAGRLLASLFVLGVGGTLVWAMIKKGPALQPATTPPVPTPGEVIAAKRWLGAVSLFSRTPAAAQSGAAPFTYTPASSPTSDATEPDFVAALAVFQADYNRAGAPGLRTDGVLDRPTYDALEWVAAQVAVSEAAHFA